MTPEFDLGAALFMRVRRAVDPADMRPCLMGVLVEPIKGGGAWLVATDGDAMLVARDDSAKAARRAVIKIDVPDDEDAYGGERLLMSFGDDDAAVAKRASSCDGYVWHRYVARDLRCANKYPRWRKAWSGRLGQKAATYGLNPLQLHRICGNDCVIIREADPRGARVLTFPYVPSLAGLIMPTGHKTAGAVDMVEQIIAAAKGSEA